MKRNLRHAIAAAGAAAVAIAAFQGEGMADEYHYNSVFMGPRVSGLAGTMIGLADDPSTAWYNPAGLHRAMGTTVTVSATALLAHQMSVKNMYGSDMSYKSTSAFTPAGITTTRLGKGNLAFMVLEPDSDSFRLDEDLSGVEGYSGGRVLYTYDGSTYVVGASYGASVGKGLALGIGFGYVYQSQTSYSLLHAELGPLANGAIYAAQYETTISTISHGLLMLAGLLWSPLGEDGPLTIGLSFRTGANISVSSSFWDQSWSGGAWKQGDPILYERTSDPSRNKEGASRTPPMMGVGAAWKVFPWWTVAADMTLNGYVKYNSFGETVRKLTTINASAASEFDLGDGLSFRFGAYTNRSSAPKDVDNAIYAWDEYGATIGGTFQRGNYDFTLALRASWLTGRVREASSIGSNGQETEEPTRYDITGRNMGLVFGGKYKF